MKVLVLAFVAIVVAVSAVPHRQWRTNREGTGEPACQATGVQVVHNGVNLLISWTVTDVNACPIDHYKVSLTVDDVVIPLSQLVPGVPIAQHPMEAPSCEKISAVVESYATADADTSIATTKPKDLELKLPNIGGVGHTQNANGVKISWNKFDLPEKCVIDYIVTVDGNDEAHSDVTSYEIPSANLQACKPTTLTIEAQSNGIVSEKESYTFTTKMSAVELKVANTENVIQIDFIPLAVDSIPGECGSVSYKVVETPEACFNSRYEVSAVSDGAGEGLKASKVIEKKPTAVNNLQGEIRRNEIQLEWKPPTEAEKCNLEYIGKYGNRDPSAPVHSTSLTFTYDTAACTVDEIEVWAISKGLAGDISKINIVGTFGKVKELICKLDTDNTTVKCEWKKPEGCADNTSMLYEITYYDGAKTKTSTQADLTLDFPTTSCSSSWVSVTPQLADSASGDLTETKVTGCPTSFISSL